MIRSHQTIIASQSVFRQKIVMNQQLAITGQSGAAAQPELRAQVGRAKVLFLDLDGVLNSRRTCIAFGDFPHGLDPVAVAKFDPVGLALVRHFCRAAGVSVVLSSSWRRLYPWAEVGAALQLPIIDATPRLDGPRGNEIAAWLAAHPEVEQWAILDDDSDMLDEQLPRFVRTPHSDGLTWATFERLCGLFAITPHECHPRFHPADAQSAA